MLDYCGWCNKHITWFQFTKIATREVGRTYWFCSLRCYTEWHRRFYVKRRMIDLQIEGNPFDNLAENLPMLNE